MPDRLETASRIATLGLMVLVGVAPYEALRPLLQLPGQSLTTVEVALLTVLSACAVTGFRARVWRLVPRADVLPWSAWAVVALLCAASAPAFRGNAVHMALRVVIAGAVWGVAAFGGRTERTRSLVMSAALGSAVLVAILVIADFAGIRLVERFLSAFRTGLAVVGAQVRAAGPFQYPTIASMYLEIAFALGLGLLAAAETRPLRTSLALVAALAVVAEAVVLTFTRAGLITLAMSMGLVSTLLWRRGPSRTLWMIAALAVILAVQLLSSRSAEMLMLRLTSEDQGRWFSAVFDAPSSVTLDTQHPIDVPLTITNTGRATWDSDAAEPVKVSYHWIANDSDEVVAWEGIRTPFDEPVRPGQTVSVVAKIGGPGRPGHFRLLWDIEQEQRLWFSTEPDATLEFSAGAVTGPVTTKTFGFGPKRIPRMAVRPGRLVLWGAALRMFGERPLRGVGPDNYRLLYGRYSTLKVADPRVHSNNMYIEVLAGMGLLGAASFAWLGYRSARAALTAAMSGGVGPGIAAACLAIATHGLVDSFLSFTGTYIFMAVTLGLATGCASVDERHAYRV